LNRDFVCIKVDPTSGPTWTRAISAPVQALSGRAAGHSPRSLTPEGEVFFGGTYFPPDNNAYGRPGFRRVLMEIARTFREEQERVTTNAHAIREHVVQTLDEAKPRRGQRRSGQRRLADQMAKAFDVRYGGFGAAPKFPHPAAKRIPARALA